MSDWSVGDLAAFDEKSEPCVWCRAASDAGYPFGEDGVFEVVAVYPPEFPGDTLGLGFASDFPDHGWCECAYRKIVADEQEACEPEFVTLLKRFKHKVVA